MSKTTDSESSGNSRSTSKSFSLSMPFRRNKAGNETTQRKRSIAEIKLKVEQCFENIDNKDAERLRYKIRSTREVQDLWMLRSDIHQLISRHNSQQEAALRINALLPYFEHWMPAQALVKI